MLGIKKRRERIARGIVPPIMPTSAAGVPRVSVSGNDALSTPRSDGHSVDFATWAVSRGMAGMIASTGLQKEQLVTDGAKGDGLVEASGVLHIFRTFGMALHPPKLAIAVLAIIASYLAGGLLDVVYKMGDDGLDLAAIDRYVTALSLSQPYEEPQGEAGVFAVWITHERRCVEGFLGSAIPGLGAATAPWMRLPTIGAGPIGSLCSAGLGFCWMAREHPVFSFFLFGSLLAIWGIAGGAICRIAAVQFTQGEKLTAMQGIRFARKNFLNGFALAPCIPLLGVAAIALVMAFGGVFLRIPFVGDLVGGLLFVLAILGGFVVSALLVGLVLGGNLFWPAIAAEGQDAYDAFSRGLSYVFTRPWKTVLYSVTTALFACVCWFVVKSGTFLGLHAARTIVSFGTSPFGLWSRGSEDAPVSKLDLLWPLGGPGKMYHMPDWSGLAWYEHVSAFLIGLFVLLVIAVMWSFLVSFYFSGSSVVYFLLRRDVDGIDLEDLYCSDAELPGAGAIEAPAPSVATVAPASAEPAPEPNQEPKDGDDA